MISLQRPHEVPLRGLVLQGRVERLRDPYFAILNEPPLQFHRAPEPRWRLDDPRAVGKGMSRRSTH
jgi:hypothetical protein